MLRTVLFTCLLSCLGAAWAVGQTFDSTHFAVPTSLVDYYRDSTTFLGQTVNHSATLGAGQTFDFSTLDSTQASFQYLLQDGIIVQNRTGNATLLTGNLNLVNTLNIAASGIDCTSTSVTYPMTEVPGVNNFTVTFGGVDGNNLLLFPLTFGANATSDTAGFNTTVTTNDGGIIDPAASGLDSFRINRSMIKTYSVDASGTLNLAGRSIPDVIRVRTELVYTDSITSWKTGQATSTPGFTDANGNSLVPSQQSYTVATQYLYLSPSTSFPLLWYNVDPANNNTVTSFVRFNANPGCPAILTPAITQELDSARGGDTLVFTYNGAADPNLTYNWELNVDTISDSGADTANREFTASGDTFTVILPPNAEDSSAAVTLTAADSSGCTGNLQLETFQVRPALVNSRAEGSIAGLHYYPNPARDYVMLDGLQLGQEAEVRLLDPRGALMLQHSLTGQPSNRVELPSNLAEGLYFMQVRQGDKASYIRLQILR